jgi:hypothetical protein
MTRELADEVERYLETGEYDLLFSAWPGNGWVEKGRRGKRALLDALIAEVRGRSGGAAPPPVPGGLDVAAFARSRVEPMVRGLFARREQEAVLDLLARSVVFLTPANIAEVLASQHWLSTARGLANLYLQSMGAEPLSTDAPSIVGMSVGATCYVSCEYLRGQDRLEDYLVHEAAHVFHNCKRHTPGLAETRRREWLLPIAFARRETFAWCCETYSRIVALGRSPAARVALLAEVERGRMPCSGEVDGVEYVDILREAVAARNGWKRILGRCTEATTTRPAARDGAPAERQARA